VGGSRKSTVHPAPVAAAPESLAHIHHACSQLIAQLRELDTTLGQLAGTGEAWRNFCGFGTMGRRCAQLQDCLVQNFRSEEAMFNCLQARQPETQAMVRSLTREHRALERSFSILVLALKALTTGEDAAVDLCELQDETRELIQAIERHLDSENTLLPLLEAS